MPKLKTQKQLRQPKAALIKNPELMLVEDMASFSKDPLKFVIYSFPWGSGELISYSGPEDWQKELLEAIRDGLLTPGQAIRLATASGAGIGKSAFVAWLILWSLSTFEDTRGVVTANTENQLRTKTWAELAKWHRMFIARHWFHLTATAIYSAQPSHEKTWRIDQIPWSEQNSEAFAGLHNKGKRVVLIFDESSAIPDIIWEVAEAALTDEDTEIIWAVFGNPTRNEGRFCRCLGADRHRWKVWQIDSRKVNLTNKTQIAQWIEDYGEDSDFVRVRVRGELPNISDRQFIPSSYVQAARGRQLPQSAYVFAAKIIAVEPAWCVDDKTEILTNCGFKFFKDLSGLEKVLSVPVHSDIAEWMPITKIYKYEFKGKLNQLNGRRGVDFCITDDHKLLAKHPKGDWKLDTYANLPNEFVVRRINSWAGKSRPFIKFTMDDGLNQVGRNKKSWKFQMIDWAEFLGWFVSEGCVITNGGRNVIEISQVNKDKVEKISELLKRMGLPICYRGHSFVISNTAIGNHLLEHCGKYAKNKRIPLYIKEGNIKNIKVFLDSFSEGDGHKMRGGAAYFTTSRLLADDIQECLIKIGRAGKLTKRCLCGSKFKIGERLVIRKNDCYSVWQNKSNSDGIVWKSKVKKIDYEGYVYCVSTPYHTILLRRNGVCMWSGNCGGDEFVIGIRQGNYFRILGKYARNDNDFIMAGYIANFEDTELADAVFVDLGYGTGIISAGKQMKRNWTLIPFGGASSNPGFLNKRAEMWGMMKDWLKDGGSIPDDPVLAAEICSPEYYIKSVGVHSGKIVLESKEDMKRRGVSSPNRADCLSLTFALPVMPKFRFGGNLDVIVTDRAEFASAGANKEFAVSNYSPLK